MKGLDNMLCASQASMAICSSMEMQPSSSSSTTPSSSSSTILPGGRAIDRHNPIIRDQKRTPRIPPTPPCTSQPPPINPKPYHLLHKIPTKKNSSKNKNESPNDQSKRVSFLQTNDQTSKESSSQPTPEDTTSSSNLAKRVVSKRWSIDPGVDFLTPPDSSRYLLGDTAKYFDGLSDRYDPVLPGFNIEPVGSNNRSSQDLISISTGDSNHSTTTDNTKQPSPTERPSNQVVVLRVSLHCKGCEGKVRKHLSRMEGVTSYSIDFAAKKVTIIGDVTPLSVLASVSKVKNAQFWPSTTTAPTASNNLPININK